MAGRSIQKSMSTSMLVNFMKLPTGTTVKASTRQEFTSGFSCVQLKQMVGGEPLVELDFLNNIFKVKGKDLTAEYRENN
jgi:P2 family phage contractile tail tube protein